MLNSKNTVKTNKKGLKPLLGDPEMKLYAMLPIVTPFFSDGSHDPSPLRDLGCYYHEGGVKEFFVSGTTGRQPWLSLGERAHNVEVLRKTLPEALIAAGCSAGSLPQMIAHASAAKDAGANIAVVTPPWGSRYSPQEIDYILAKFGDACLELAIKAAGYSIPGIGLSEIPLESVLRLAQHPAYVIFKCSETNQKPWDISDFLRSLDPHLAYLQGVEPLITTTLQAGGQGLVSSLMHLGSPPFLALLQAAEQGNWEEVERLQKAIDTVYGLVVPWYNRLGGTSAIYHFLNVHLRENVHLCNLLLPHEGETPESLRQDALKAYGLLKDCV
jgi:4-hydroxy-tetrahydrodipicolinate synthase